MRRRLLYVLEVSATEFVYRFTDTWTTHSAQIRDLPENLQGKIKENDWLFVEYR